MAYERVFQTEFDGEAKRLFRKWLLRGSGRLREVWSLLMRVLNVGSKQKEWKQNDIAKVA